MKTATVCLALASAWHGAALPCVVKGSDVTPPLNDGWKTSQHGFEKQEHGKIVCNENSMLKLSFPVNLIFKTQHHKVNLLMCILRSELPQSCRRR